jgi:hypothetical protein
MPFHLNPSKNILLLYTGSEHKKICLLGFSSIKSMLQVLIAIAQNLCCKKETCGYAKVIHKKRKKKELRKKIDKCPRY